MEQDQLPKNKLPKPEERGSRSLESRVNANGIAQCFKAHSLPTRIVLFLVHPTFDLLESLSP